MKKIDGLAHKVLSKTSIQEDQQFGSVLAIIMIIGIIVNVVRVVQECEKKNTNGIYGDDLCLFFRKTFKYLSLRRGWYTSMRLKKIIRQHLPIKDYRAYKQELHDAILDTGINLSAKETQILMEAINND